ncbi:hypothetical protein BX661DRAFT_10372 [Kickxella alabastrina]|uniref:uncharacterized protein n=1 Tax=Kickxella alabastrina TaxID=61397 RepID=UPI00221FC942|nr:uncharacterized protein BX661DRAFT_10372 [Kickxella alabastrina]KAI7835054.1 hypothetical protein BX661DRAFT_10372 [Kickxella alabastrina]
MTKASEIRIQQLNKKEAKKATWRQKVEKPQKNANKENGKSVIGRNAKTGQKYFVMIDTLVKMY